ncbi:MAG: DUF4013 domain-containing protein [candidate division Zixibacteria bacterium]|nr:DUF4013 domain-containing protein [candidate division Zixibacteria bacterium]
MDNLGRSFTYMFEDPEWLQKILVGALFVLASMILIGIPFLLGYVLLVARNTANGQPLPLPAWDNLGEKFTQGLLFFVVIILYAIPLIIVNFILMMIPCIGWLAMVALSIAYAMILPYIYVRFARTGNISDAFDFAGMIAFLTQNTVNLLLVALLTIVFSILASFGILALIIGYFFTAFWAQLGIAYLYGEVVRVGEQKGGAVTTQP